MLKVSTAQLIETYLENNLNCTKTAEAMLDKYGIKITHQAISKRISSELPEIKSEVYGDLVAQALTAISKCVKSEDERVQIAAAKFILSTLKKDDFSEKQEIHSSSDDKIEITVVHKRHAENRD